MSTDRKNKLNKRNRLITKAQAARHHQKAGKLIFQFIAHDEASPVLAMLEQQMRKAEGAFNYFNARPARDQLISYPFYRPTPQESSHNTHHEYAYVDYADVPVTEELYVKMKERLTGSQMIDAEFRDVTPEPKALPTGDVNDE